MDGNNSGGIIIPSPLRKREFIQHEGQDYQIIKFLKITIKYTENEDGMTDDANVELSYRVRDIRTNHVVNITLPLTIQHEENREEDNYFHILELNEDKKEVTLKSFMTGTERKVKVWLDEDVEVIKDGLMEEDKDLFCTLNEVMGKQVIGDFKFRPKDQPIMRMPNEIMDVIFSKLTPEDRLSCRLVTRRWATLLPINKFVKCIKLSIDQNEEDPEESDPIIAEFQRLDIPNHPIVELDVRDRPTRRGNDDEDDVLMYANPRIRMKELQPLIDTSLLNDVDSLSVCINSNSTRIHPILTTVSHHCRNLAQFIFEDNAEEEDINWIWAKEIIAGNRHQLKSLRVRTCLREVDLSSDGQIGECTSLQDLRLYLPFYQTHSVLKILESVPLPTSIIVLSIIGGMATLTKSQLLWVTSNFPQLQDASFRVHHTHSDNFNEVDEDEVYEDSILHMMNALPSLRRLSIELNPSVLLWPREGSNCVCGKAELFLDRCRRPWRFDRSLSLSFHTDYYGCGGVFEKLEFDRKKLNNGIPPGR